MHPESATITIYLDLSPEDLEILREVDKKAGIYDFAWFASRGVNREAREWIQSEKARRAAAGNPPMPPTPEPIDQGF